MATKKKPRAAKRTTRRSKKNVEPILSPEVKREIAAVILAALTILLIFAMGNFGGSLVTGMFDGLKTAFGYAAYLLFAITGFLSIMLFNRENPPRAHNYFGWVFFELTVAALLHVTGGVDNALARAQEGAGGGYVGYFSSNVMLTVLNTPASVVVLIALIIIFLIVAANVNLRDMFAGMVAPFTRKEGNGAPAQDIKVNDPTGDGIKVNDNSGAASSLEVRGQLNLGGVAKKTAKEEPKEALTEKGDTDWEKPSLELLSSVGSKADAGDVKANAAIIKQTMESFNIGVTMGEVNVGPTVTQYTFAPPSGVKLNKITSLDTNLALSLAAHPIRIEAPIPGKSAVGVEIPNKSIAMVRLRSMLEDPAWSRESAPLTFVLGRDVSGTPMYANLQKMPHMLIAGATGSGKSAMINSFLTSLLYRNSPSEMKVILVDPKKVELGLYDKIPHLLAPVINDPEKTVSALKWAVAEMDRRYDLLKEVGNRNIDEYNKAHPDDAMPFIVIVIDEMADLMMLAGKEVEALIVRLAQMARAIGIHLVLATQRPSVDVITGVIKANVPARLAFSVASQIDSRTILDQMGAEKLLGKGDMLFASPDMMKPRRIQGAFLEEKEVKAVTDFLRSQVPKDFKYNDDVLAQKVSFSGRAGSGSSGGDGEIDDDLFEAAAEAVLAAGKASTSMLQRRLRIGYARAARLVDLLEEQGVVGPPDGARPRDVLVSSLDQIRGAGAGASPADDQIRQPEPYDD